MRFLTPLLFMVGCAHSSSPGLRAPSWVESPVSCFLRGRVSVAPEVLALNPDDALAKIACRHLRVAVRADDGSVVRVETEGHFAAGYGACHFALPTLPQGQSTLDADFDLEPALQNRFIVKSERPFNAVVCDADSRSWNQGIDLVLTLPEVLGAQEAFGK
ncbi:MAG: hypothetical protein ACKVPX_05725 [Myxococcaceae bacterium]